MDIGTRRVLWSGTCERALSPQTLLEGQAALAGAIASALGQPYGAVQAGFARRVAGGAAANMPSYACVRAPVQRCRRSNTTPASTPRPSGSSAGRWR